MSDIFDMRTFSIAAGIVAMFCCLPMIYMIGSGKTYPGMYHWTAATISSFLGLILNGLKNAIPDVFSVVVANTLIVGFVILSTRGLLEFVGRKSGRALDAAVPCGTAIVLGIFLFLWPSYAIRVTAICAVYAFYTIRSLMIIWKDFPALSLGRNWLLIITFALSVAWYVVRASLTLVFGHGADLASAYFFQTVSLVLALGAIVLVVSGYIIVSLQCVKRDLDRAQREVKTLSGLLPICSSCHKIHDGSGHWIHIESYISRHSEASFSHGLCDDCAARLYPDLVGKQ